MSIRQRVSLLALTVLTLLSSGCTSLFFYPSKEWIGTPDQLGVDYRDLQFYTEDRTRISAWFLPVPAGTEVKGTVFFLHGNAQNISYHIQNVIWLPAQGYQVFALDYRGYGQSHGVTTLPGIFADIRAGFDQMMLQDGVRGEPVFVLGQSLGASLAAYWFSVDEVRRAQIDGVVLDAPFASYADTAQTVAAESWLTWAFQYPVRWSINDDYSAGPVIQQLAPTPLLIFHSPDDAVVAFKHGKALYDQARQPKELYKVIGIHTATFNVQAYRDKFLDFMRTHSSTP